MKIVILISFALMQINYMFGQDVYWTEEELALQRTYIEANTQKLIGNIDKALTLYKKVVAEKRDIHPAWYEIARMQHASDDNEAALISINKAIKLDRKNNWYTLFKVDLYEKMGNHKDAASTLENHLNIIEPDQNLLERLGFIHAKSQNLTKAIAIYDQLENEFGIHESYSKKKYNLYLKQSEDDLAIKEIKKLISAYPYNIEYLHLLAGSLMQLQKMDEAEKIFNRILKLDPDDTKASIAMAQTYRKNGDSSEFIKSISSIISNPNLDVDIKIQELIPPLNKLVQKYDLKLSEEMIHSARLLLKAHPNEPKVYAMASDIYFHSGRYGSAKENYKKTLELNNTIYPVWEQYLYTLLVLNQPSEILSTVEEALDIFPNQGRLYYFEALALYKSGVVDGAATSLSQAEMMSRKNPDLNQYILVLKSVISAAQTDQTNSKKYLQSAIDINPKLGDQLLNSFIEDLTQQDKSKMNLFAFNQISHKNTPPAQFSSALISYLSKDLTKAMTAIQRSISGSTYHIPKVLDLYMGISEQLSQTNGDQYIQYKKALDEMGYQRIFNKVKP